VLVGTQLLKILSSHCPDCKKAFVILTISFVTRVATVDQSSPLWQAAMGSKTHMEYRISWSGYKGWEVC